MRKFSVAFLNVRSLILHFCDFRDYLTRNSYDIIGVSETWLRPHTTNNIINIPGYNLVRRDRLTRGGGVALYIKGSLNYTISYSSANETLEELWVELSIPYKKYIFGVMYRPPRGKLSDFLDIFEKRISDFQPAEIICGGDINLNLLNLSDKNRNLFYDSIESLNLQQIIREPTRMLGVTTSLLDIILIPSEEQHFQSGTQDLGISDHNLTFCQLQYDMKTTKGYIHTRNLKNIDRDLLGEFLTLAPFENIIYLNSVQDKVLALNTIFIDIFDILAPLKKINISNKKPPWLTFTIHRMIRLKNKAFEKYKKNKSEANWSSYKQIKNQTNIAIREEKKHYLQHTINTNINNLKHFWQKLNDFNIYSKVIPNQIPDALNNPEIINKHFLNLTSNIPIDAEILNFYKNNFKLNFFSYFEFTTVTESTVRKCLFDIKSSATGADQINLDMVLLCSDRILPFLTNIVNSCILDNIFPDAWKIAKVIPFAKRDHVETCNDLRPISILPVLSKVMERILNNQILDHLNLYHVLPEYQSGFRSGLGCSTALLNVTDDIIKAVDKGEATVLILIDYSKAFDGLNHELLLAILHYIGFRENAISLIASYLKNRQQYVATCKGLSTVTTQNCGVPQGSILGPLLFNIYTCNVSSCLRYCNVHLYADDTQLYYSFLPENSLMAQQRINEDISRLVDMSNKHNLKINGRKSSFMLFGRDREALKTNFKIKIGNDDVALTNSCKNLGLIFDTALRFKSHVKKRVQLAYSNLKKIFPHRYILSVGQRIRLADSLVLSHFNFADVVYGPCLDVQDKNRIQRVQKACLRFIYCLRGRQPVSHKLSDARWLSMEDRRRLHSASLFHSIILNDRPSYLSRKIRYRTDVHALNLRYRGYISPPSHSTAFYERSFSFQIYLLYNRIPNDFKKLSVRAFKIKLKIFLLHTPLW